MKIIDFVKKNKVPTIAASVVLVAAVAVGIAFGVMNHKDNVEVKPFGEESSSEGSSSTISVPPIEGNSSVESTSSEESTSSASETIETNSTPSKAESVSPKPTTTTTKPASSQPSVSNPSTGNNNGGSAGGSTGSSAPSNGGTTSTPANSGGNTGTSTKWVCPDPAAHGGEDVTCLNQSRHDSLVISYEENKRLIKETEERVASEKANGTWVDTSKYCITCHRPLGDGHNGTCRSHLENGKWTCEYDY